MKLSRKFSITILAALVWAISIVLARFILQSGENSFDLVFWTAVIALPYWCFVGLTRAHEVKKLTRRDIQILLGMGMVSGIGVAITEVLALTYSPAINYSFLIRMVIVFTVIFAYIFLGERITKKKILISLILLVGAYLLTTNGKHLTLSIGDVFTLTEAALIAFGNNVLGKIATNRMSPTISATGTYLTGFIPLIVFTLIMHHPTIPTQAAAVILLAIINILIAQLRFQAYKLASATYVTMVFSFTPVFVSFMAVGLLSEHLSVFQIIGGLLIVAAGIGVEKLNI